jgi:hypothetical protein
MLLIFAVNSIYAEEFFKVGISAKGIGINGYSFGNGNSCIIVIGGIHGRYEENTVLISERLINYCRANEGRLNSVIAIIPNLNPDGFLYKLDDPILKTNGSVIRFNGNSVDLNRNWDTPNWQPDCVYSQDDLRIGAGGESPMSENEVIALSNFIKNCNNNFQTIYIITFHSYVINKQNVSDVFPSYTINENNKIVLLENATFLANLFSKNGNFITLDEFKYYNVTGELLFWCGINNIAAIDVELGDDGDIDIKQNNKKSHWENFIECFQQLIF